VTTQLQLIIILYYYYYKKGEGEIGSEKKQHQKGGEGDAKAVESALCKESSPKIMWTIK